LARLGETVGATGRHPTDMTVHQSRAATRPFVSTARLLAAAVVCLVLAVAVYSAGAFFGAYHGSAAFLIGCVLVSRILLFASIGSVLAAVAQLALERFRGR
jgi:hypothetical protein